MLVRPRLVSRTVNLALCSQLGQSAAKHHNQCSQSGQSAAKHHNQCSIIRAVSSETSQSMFPIRAVSGETSQSMFHHQGSQRRNITINVPSSGQSAAKHHNRCSIIRAVSGETSQSMFHHQGSQRRNITIDVPNQGSQRRNITIDVPSSGQSAAKHQNRCSHARVKMVEHSRQQNVAKRLVGSDIPAAHEVMYRFFAPF